MITIKLMDGIEFDGSIIKVANIVPHKLDNLLLFLELTGRANVE